MSTSTPARRRLARPYSGYLVAYLAATVGSVWALVLCYLIDYRAATAVLGELQLTNPLVVLVLHSPAIAAAGILLHYDGLRGVVNFARSLVPRRRDLAWIPVLMVAMAVYIAAIRYVCLAVGIPVPPQPQAPLDMLWTFLRLLVMEVGMLAITVGWFGVFLPLMHRATGSHVWSGVATGVGIGVFVAPGNLFASFELATAWPLYVAQLCVLSVGMSMLLSRLKGNVLFFLLPFWVSASGSAMGLYYFTAATQVVQLVLFACLVGVLSLVLHRQGGGTPSEPYVFPEYLERDYTVRMGSVLRGAGDRSRDIAAARAAAQPAETAEPVPAAPTAPGQPS